MENMNIDYKRVYEKCNKLQEFKNDTHIISQEDLNSYIEESHNEFNDAFKELAK